MTENIPGHLAQSILKYIENSSNVLKIREQQKFLSEVTNTVLTQIAEYRSNMSFSYNSFDSDDEDDNKFCIYNYLKTASDKIHELELCDSICNAECYCRKCYMKCNGCYKLKKRKDLINFEDNRWCKICFGKEKVQIQGYIDYIESVFSEGIRITAECITHNELENIKKIIPKIEICFNNTYGRSNSHTIDTMFLVEILKKLTKIVNECYICRIVTYSQDFLKIKTTSAGLGGNYSFYPVHNDCLSKKCDKYRNKLKLMTTSSS